MRAKNIEIPVCNSRCQYRQPNNSKTKTTYSYRKKNDILYQQVYKINVNHKTDEAHTMIPR